MNPNALAEAALAESLHNLSLNPMAKDFTPHPQSGRRGGHGHYSNGFGGPFPNMHGKHLYGNGVPPSGPFPMMNGLINGERMLLLCRQQLPV